MRSKLLPLFLLLALLVGFGIGLGYTWVFSPIQFVDAQPHMLRADFKDAFRSVIAAAYASNGDLERARARLDLLGDTDAYQSLTAQAQRMLAAGEPAESIQKVALLASALQGMQVAAVEPTATEPPLPSTTGTQNSPPEGTETAPEEPTETQSVSAGPPVSETESAPTATPGEALTATPRPTRTATPTLGAPYQLIGQDTVCDVELEEGLLQVVVTNLQRRQIPGAEIIISWNAGEEHIFTGLKPELGHGYADFVMDHDVNYSVRMADGGTPASGISAPECAGDGEPYIGGIRLTFQQP